MHPEVSRVIFLATPAANCHQSHRFPPGLNERNLCDLETDVSISRTCFRQTRQPFRIVDDCYPNPPTQTSCADLHLAASRFLLLPPKEGHDGDDDNDDDDDDGNDGALGDSLLLAGGDTVALALL